MARTKGSKNKPKESVFGVEDTTAERVVEVIDTVVEVPNTVSSKDYNEDGVFMALPIPEEASYPPYPDTEAVRPMSPPTKSFSIGFTVQPEEYSPVKINLSMSRSQRPDEMDADFMLNLAAELFADLDRVAKEAIRKVQSVKAEIMEDLSDGE